MAVRLVIKYVPGRGDGVRTDPAPPVDTIPLVPEMIRIRLTEMDFSVKKNRISPGFLRMP